MKKFAMMLAVLTMAASGLAQNAVQKSYVNKALVQAAVVNTTGTFLQGYVPMFSDSIGDVTDSNLFQAANGNLGLGTTNPQFNLHFVSTVDPAAVTVDGYGNTGVNFIGRRAGGTPLAPTQATAGSNLMTIQGRGYTGTQFTASSRANIKFNAAENFTDAAQGALITFATTQIGTAPATASERMRITDAGKVGIGTTTPNYTLDVNGTGNFTGLINFASGQTFPGTGSVTGVTAGAGLAGGTITTSGTLSVLYGASANTAAQGNDPRLGDARTPLPGSGYYIQNGTTAQTGNMNITGTGIFGALNAAAATVAATSPSVATNAIYAINQSFDANANAIYAVIPQAGSSASAIFGQTFGSGVPVYGNANNATVQVTAVEGDAASSAGTGVQGFAFAQSGNTTAVAGRIRSPNGVAILGSGIAQNCSGATCTPVTGGTAGEFQTFAGGTLLLGQVVDANFNPTSVFRVDSTGKAFFDGGSVTGGADFAESVAVHGSNAAYSSGDLITVDPTGDRRFTLAGKAYSTLVAGIYATKPGILATTNAMNDARLASEIPLAIVGIVPCKVSAENGPIHPGDLLVSSSRPGHAMRGTDHSRMLGAVVGKALGSLDAGTGVIEVLVTLQ